MKAEDFFRVLKERGIRKKDTPYQNLQEFLMLSSNFPDLLVLKNVRKTLEQMAENEEFMAAIQEDVLAGEEQAAQDEELAKIRGDDHDNSNDQQSSNNKLETVGEVMGETA